MNNSVITPEKEKVFDLAEQYKNEGFDVVVEPFLDNLPFDLGTYLPDIIAQKGDMGFIIEVKRSYAKLSVERLKEVVDEVRKHPGWRFLLVTADDIFSREIRGQSDLPGEIDFIWKMRHDAGDIQSQDDLSLSQVMNRFSQAERLYSSGDFEPAFLMLWLSFEGLSRIHSLQISMPIERFPIAAMIKHLYSQGELSIEQYDNALLLLEKRNRLIHGYSMSQIPDEFSKLRNLILELLKEWNLSSLQS